MRRFAELFARSGELDAVDFDAYLDGMPRLSTREAECCERPVSVEEVADTLSRCARSKSPELDCLPYELYFKQI